MNTRSTNDSNFRHGHFTISCLEIFDKFPVLESIESSHIQEVCPSTSFDETSTESEFEITDRKFFYLDVATSDTKSSDYYTIDAGLYPSISDILNEMNKKTREREKYEKIPIKLKVNRITQRI